MPYSAENTVRAAKRVPSLICKFIDLFSLLLIFLTPLSHFHQARNPLPLNLK